jgi:hypothetical protein
MSIVESMSSFVKGAETQPILPPYSSHIETPPSVDRKTDIEFDFSTSIIL